MADIGTGASITFGTSSWTGDIVDISGDGMSREAIDVSHLNTTDWKEFLPSDNTDPGSITLEILFDPDDEPPITSAKETVTVTFPLPAGMSTAATWASDAFVTDFSYGVPYEDRMTASMTLKLSGEITFTNASA